MHQRHAVTRIGRQSKTPIDRALGCFTEVDSDSNVAERQTDVVGAAARRDNQDGRCGLDGNALGQPHLHFAQPEGSGPRHQQPERSEAERHDRDRQADTHVLTEPD